VPKDVLGKQTLCQLSYSRSGGHTGYQPCAAKITTGAAVVAIVQESGTVSRVRAGLPGAELEGRRCARSPARATPVAVGRLLFSDRPQVSGHRL